jgi:MoaA/NifB/PqqE/SkfB family radical SAM enzyme
VGGAAGLDILGRALRPGAIPTHLTVYVTGRCNLRCRHCFHFEEVREGLPGLDLERIQRLGAGAGRLLWVSLGGGEPFLRDDLVEIGAAFPGVRHLTIPTNGLVPGTADTVAALAGRMPGTGVFVSVSLDGPEEVHDSIRGRRGAFQKSIKGLCELQDIAASRSNLSVGVITCVTAENQDLMPAFVEDVAALDPDHLTINLARGKALDQSLLDVDRNVWQATLDVRARLHKEGRLRTWNAGPRRLMRARDRAAADLVAGRAWAPCTAGELSAVVTEDGTVLSCEILEAELGNLADFGDDLLSLWASPGAVAVRRRIREERCACTWECAMADNALFRKRLWPRLATHALVGR